MVTTLFINQPQLPRHVEAGAVLGGVIPKATATFIIVKDVHGQSHQTIQVRRHRAKEWVEPPWTSRVKRRATVDLQIIAHDMTLNADRCITFYDWVALVSLPHRTGGKAGHCWILVCLMLPVRARQGDRHGFLEKQNDRLKIALNNTRPRCHRKKPDESNANDATTTAMPNRSHRNKTLRLSNHTNRPRCWCKT